ncbi:MAG: hypothetical protein ACLP7Q_18290 [Isosphaeraceae bacterium]
MSREYCMFVLEGGSGANPYCNPIAPAASANIWTVAASTGLPGTDGGSNYAAFYARLDGDDGFTMRPRPVMVSVPYGGGFATRAFTVSDKQEMTGTYKTKLYAGAFTQMLLQLACQQVNSLGWVGASGVSSGWQYGPAAGVAGNQVGNLPSVSIFHAIQKGDGTYKHRLYRGVRVTSWQFTLSENSTIGDLTLQLVGGYAAGNPFAYLNSVDPTAQTFSIPATVPTFGTTTTPSTWCAPSTENYPVNPWLFINTCSTAGAGGNGSVTIGAGTGTARTTFQSLSMSCTNQMMKHYWANRYLQIQQLVGRQLTVSLESWYTSTPDDRTQYEQNASQLATIVLGDGTHSITVTMNANNIITTLDDRLPLADIYTQNMTLTSQFDPSYSQLDQALAADFQVAFAE